MTEKNPEVDDLPELPDSAELTSTPPSSAPEELPELPDEVELVAATSPEPRPLPAQPPPAELEPVPDLLTEDVLEDEDVLEFPQETEAPTPPPAAPRATSPPVSPEADTEVPLSPAATAAALAEGETPPLRELDAAPAHLRTAATVVVIGALLPFVVSSETPAMGGVAYSLGGKALMLVAAWLWARQVIHNFGPELGGLIGSLASKSLKPAPKKEEAEKKKRRASARKAGPAAMASKYAFPTVLHLVAILCMVGGLVLAGLDPRRSFGPVGLVETGILGWSAFTYVHILAYQRWSSFNPLFALMFIAMALAGIASVLAGLNQEGIWKIFSMAGGVIVGGGGGLAVYTMVEAMMAAKKEGDRKKAEAIEARKAARKSKR